MSTSLPALDVQTPSTPNVMDQYQNMLKIQAMRQGVDQQQQLAPLQQQQAQNDVQSSTIDLQQKQQAQKDQQATTAAMGAWDGKDFGKLSHLILENGGSGNAVNQVQKTEAEQRKQASDQAHTDALTGQATVETQMKKNDMISGPLGVLVDPKQTPDAQLPQMIMQTAQSLQQQGLLDPQHMQAAQQLAQTAQANPTQARQGLDTMRKGVMANSQILADAKDKAETARADAQANEATVNATLAPQKAAQTQAYQRQELGQGAARINIEDAKLKFQQRQSGLTAGGDPSDLAQGIASGHITPDRMGYLLSKNPTLIQGVLQVDPTFDSSKAGAYPNVYKDFTSTKPNSAGGALLAGGTALQHLKELKEMNTGTSHIPGTADYNAYQNKVDTVAGELARFYGTDTVPGIANIKKTLAATLPGQRDAAIETQVRSMGDRLDNYEQTWQNAAPSKNYEAPMPGISAKAKDARAALDPAYRARTQQAGGGSSGMVTVQIPGSPPGQIPAAALHKFQADHPNAVVRQ